MVLSKPIRKPLQELNGKTRLKKAIEAVAMFRQAAREYGVKSTTVENVEHVSVMDWV